MNNDQKAMFFDSLIEAGLLDTELYDKAKAIYFAKQEAANES